MTSCLTKTLIMTALFGLAACGGGGSGGVSATPTPGTNGLDFGFPGQELDDAEGAAVTMSTAAFQEGSGATTTDATITLDAGFFAGANNGTIQIFGETVTITNGAGNLSGGEDVQVIYETDRSGTYAAALEVSVSGTGMGAVNGEGAYVFGFETDPTELAALTSGSATYEGGFQVAGVVDDGASTAEYEGTITVTADFLNDLADVELDGTFDGGTDIDMEGTDLAIATSGFAGALSCTSGCSASSSNVDATFYGPDGAELGGVLGIGFTAGAADYDGVGTFIITPQP